jgi:hypothetical protein
MGASLVLRLKSYDKPIGLKFKSFFFQNFWLSQGIIPNRKYLDDPSPNFRAFLYHGSGAPVNFPGDAERLGSLPGRRACI